MAQKVGLAIALLMISALVAGQALGGFDGSGYFPEPNGRKVVIYKNEACGHCEMYLMEFSYFLRLHGYTDVQEKLMINDPAIREELARLTAEKRIPLDMQGHMVIIVDDRLVLEGHVPIPILEGFFEEFADKPFPKIVVLQDSMEPFSELKAYKVMGEDGKISEKKINESIMGGGESGQGTNGSQNGEKGGNPKGNAGAGKIPLEGLVPLVAITGLVDGINPCAFGVLLFFITFLYAMRRSRLEIWKVGAVFIAMVFLTYLMIGLGLLQAIMVSGEPHLFGKLSAMLMLILGLVSIKDYFFYGKWFSLRMPSFAAPLIKDKVKEMTMLSVVVLGVLVGLCTFPCSGGIYVGILSLLAMQTTFWEGLAYLLLYNFMFVVPLTVILLLATSGKVTERLEVWEKEHKSWMKLAAGLIMIGLAAILWVVSS